MSAQYLSYLMGASHITDDDLHTVGAEIVGRKGSGSRELHIPAASLAAYEALVTEKLDVGFWNDIVSEDEIIFIFKLKDGTVKRLVFSEETHDAIGELCAELSGDPIEKTRHVLVYLGSNPFYDDVARRYHYKHVHRAFMGSGALFTNAKDEVLILRPAYKPGWCIPGGNTDAHETPSHACIREIEEEIGVHMQNPRLLCVQHTIDTSCKGDHLQFIFDGGVLTEEDIATITLDAAEIAEMRFVPLAEAVTLLGARLGQSVSASYKTRMEDTIVYVETTS